MMLWPFMNSCATNRICLPTQIHQNIEPFIDLNVRGTKNLETNGDIKISPEGIPVCSRGKKMRHDGFDHSQNRHKWKCPTMQGRTTNICPKPCSTAKYGRTFHTSSKDNPRLFPKTPRNSTKWKLVYKRRTAAERCNNGISLNTEIPQTRED